MLFHDFLAKPAAADAADDLALITWDAQATWSELGIEIEKAKQWLVPIAKRRIGFQFCPSVHGFAVLAALDFHQCETFLLDEYCSKETIESATSDFNFDALVRASAGKNAEDGELQTFASTDQSVSPGVTILTSGTEGKPKAARHTWQSLSRPVRISNPPKQLRWLLAFRPHLYAGIQVILQCFANCGCLVVPRYRAEAQDVATMIVDRKVQCVSATPSYWRRLVLFTCLLYTSPSPRDATLSRMPSSA